MEFDLVTTVAAFVGLIAIGVGGLLVSEVMPPRTTLMMVLPSMVVFGAVCLGIGVLYGEYRADRPG